MPILALPSGGDQRAHFTEREKRKADEHRAILAKTRSDFVFVESHGVN